MHRFEIGLSAWITIAHEVFRWHRGLCPPQFFFRRNRFIGDHRPIDVAGPFEHHSVDREFSSGANPKLVAFLNHINDYHPPFALGGCKSLSLNLVAHGLYSSSNPFRFQGSRQVCLTPHHETAKRRKVCLCKTRLVVRTYCISLLQES